jgi:PAS domain S-box-containing protein
MSPGNRGAVGGDGSSDEAADPARPPGRRRAAQLRLQRELTERLRAEAALRHSEERFRRITETITDYVFTVTVDSGNPVRTVHGPGCVAVTGYTAEEFAHDPGLWLRMVVPEDRAAVQEQARQVLTEGHAGSLDHRIALKDGAVRWVRNTPVPQFDDGGTLIAYDGLIQDITERRLLEEQLRQAQKMEAIGQLAGGIAHDFNNLLTAIRGFTEQLDESIPAGNPGRAVLAEIERAADRAAELTRQLLAFSRRQAVNLVPIDLHAVVTETVPLLRRLIGEDVDVRVKAGPKLPRVLADHAQLGQVLLNLAANARDAMPDGGTLGIELEAVETDADFVRTHEGSESGPHVMLAVSDTGVGMAEETQAHLFEPFYTTKELGKGTGLGLASVYGIVKQARGSIYVESQPGRGSTFRIYLPAAAEVDIVSPVTSVAPAEHTSGQDTVLLVEDEPDVRAFARRVLERHGHRVIACANPAEALELVRSDPKAFDLLVTDVLMPHMSGPTLADHVLALRPNVPVLFMSGHTPGQFQGRLLAKPFTGTELLAAVHELLDGAGGSRG